MPLIPQVLLEKFSHIWYILFVCEWAAVSTGFSPVVPAHLSYQCYIVNDVLNEQINKKIKEDKEEKQQGKTDGGIANSQTAQKQITKVSVSNKDYFAINESVTTVPTVSRRTSSVSSILNVIFPMLSPTRLKSRMTPALDRADVLVARGRSPSTSRKSTKLGSVCKSG